MDGNSVEEGLSNSEVVFEDDLWEVAEDEDEEKPPENGKS